LIGFCFYVIERHETKTSIAFSHFFFLCIVYHGCQNLNK
jgi:hypothetical protein